MYIHIYLQLTSLVLFFTKTLAYLQPVKHTKVFCTADEMKCLAVILETGF